MPPRPITALFTSDEETGSTSSRLLIENLAKNACLVLVLGEWLTLWANEVHNVSWIVRKTLLV
jgi:acetylornithine deacetylase/succinyl-diaminopimelate desuccinylase-like protein